MISNQQQYVELYNLAQGYHIISLDIFDTVLLRSFARSDHIFNLIEHALILKFGVQMQGYKDLRLQAMKDCKAKLAEIGNQEVTLNNVINHIDILDENQKQFALKLELEIEEKHLKANSPFVEFIKNMRLRGKKIIYCSDTYFEDEFIKNILKRESIWRQGDQLYTSLQLQKNKADGDLFTEVLKLEDLHVDQLLHIGDNYRADYKMPKSHDIAAFWLRNPISQDWSKDYSFLMLEQDKRGANQTDHLDIMPSTSLGLNNLYHQQENKGLLFDLGYHVLAPLFLKIAYDIKNLQDQQQNDIILFLARDGYILSKIYASLFDDQCRYFPASRRLLCLPSADYGEFTSIILGGRRGRNIQSYLNSFPAPQKFIDTLKQHFNDFGQPLSKKNFSLFRNIVRKHWNDIQMELKKEQKNLLSFLKQELDNYHKIMIFDLGWKGSLLQKFQEIMPDKVWNGYYFATLEGAITDLNIRSFALDHGEPKERNTLYFHNQELLELFFCEPDESFERITYDSNTNQYTALRNQKSQTPYAHQKMIKEGVLSFIYDFDCRFSKDQQRYLMQDMDPVIFLDQFICHPKKQEAKIFEAIYDYATTGSGHKAAFVQSGSLKKYRESLWKQGSFALSSRFHKLIITIYNWQKNI